MHPNLTSSPASRAIDRFLSSPFSLLLAVVLAFVLNAYSLPLTDVDEGAFTEATREMMARGNLVSPMLNDVPRHDKPILIYWAQAASVTLLGQSELGYRLPSLIAALCWLFALYRFCLRHGGRQTAQIAGLVMALSLMVGFVAKAAIADALLNLFIALAMFGIYDYFCDCRDGRGDAVLRRRLLAVYAALGLGFLTKGPVAVFFPLLVSGIFFGLSRNWRCWSRALFYWPGWLLFLAIVVPWHVMVWLDQGDAFFRGFYLKHNVGRYSDTFEGHGGSPFYYLVALPLILMPFTGWLAVISARLARQFRWTRLGTSDGPGQLERFLLTWFVVVFAFFSFSSTQLPHYVVYGCTPLFILLARHPLNVFGRWLAYLPLLIFALVIAGLPWLLPMAAAKAHRPLESMLLAGLVESFSGNGRWLLLALPLVVLGMALWRRLPVWQGLVLSGLVQAAVVFGVVGPRVIEVTQGPVREAARVARELDGPVVAWRIYQPSFSVYRQAVTPSRLPQAGELVLTRTDRYPDLGRAIAPLVAEPVYQRGFVTLARVDRERRP